jgi:hypothetical protein
MLQYKTYCVHICGMTSYIISMNVNNTYEQNVAVVSACTHSSHEWRNGSRPQHEYNNSKQDRKGNFKECGLFCDGCFHQRQFFVMHTSITCDVLFKSMLHSP